MIEMSEFISESNKVLIDKLNARSRHEVTLLEKDLLSDVYLSKIAY